MWGIAFVADPNQPSTWGGRAMASPVERDTQQEAEAWIKTQIHSGKYIHAVEIRDEDAR